MCPTHHGERPALFRNLVPLVLASRSPRRQALLSTLGLSFRVIPAEIEENIGKDLPPEVLVEELAHRKAQAVASRFPEAAILAADTVVVRDTKILGKPSSPEEAQEMLRSLSGTWHQVFTGVCLLWKERQKLFHTVTEVRFRVLTPEEIRAYISTGEPMDKAGAYAIQGLAAAFVEGVKGSVTGVVGLPLAETIKILQEWGVIVPALRD